MQSLRDTLVNPIGASVLGGVSFAALSHPVTYGLTGKVTEKFLPKNAMIPLYIHAFVHALLMRAVMFFTAPMMAGAWVKSLIAGILFAVIGHPATFKAVGSVVPKVLSSEGKPTLVGVAVHGGVYALASYTLMALA